MAYRRVGGAHYMRSAGDTDNESRALIRLRVVQSAFNGPGFSGEFALFGAEKVIHGSGHMSWESALGLVSAFGVCRRSRGSLLAPGLALLLALVSRWSRFARKTQ